MSASPNPQPLTIRELLKRSAEYLAKNGSASPRLDADLLLADALACERLALYLDIDRIPDDEQTAAYRERIRRRGQGEPVAYILGHKEFYNLPIRVDPRVLIPRPETELLVEAALKIASSSSEYSSEPQSSSPTSSEPPSSHVVPPSGGLSSSNEPLTILDIGTGSGAIALALAKKIEHAEIHAADISPDALALARENAQTLGLADRVQFHQSDLDSSLPTSLLFDLIVSNPPYIPETDRGTLSRDILNHEPHSALFAGPDGLDTIRRLIAAAPSRLKPNGALLIEIGANQSNAIRELIAATPHLALVKILPDLANIPRVVIARRTD